MFGYILTNADELKVRELKRYRAYYCGLCHMLLKKYGLRAQLSVNFDTTFLVVLLSSVYDKKDTKRKARCVVSPFKRRDIIQNRFTGFAADMTVLLMYYKCMDDWKDDRNVLKAGYAASLKKAAETCTERHPRRAAGIRHYLSVLNRYETSGMKDLDLTAGAFGRVCREVFTYDGVWKEQIRDLGYYIGRFVYIMDAYDDVADDIKKNEFNPLSEKYKVMKPEEFDEFSNRILTHEISGAARIFEMLPAVEDAGILRNILYSGVWYKFMKIRDEREKKKNLTGDFRAR